MKKSALATLMVLVGAGLVYARAPQDSANPITDSIKAQHAIVKDYVTRSAAMLDEKDYGFKPAGVAAEVRSFGQMLGHIANAQNMLCGAVIGAGTGGAERGPGGVDYEKTATKAGLQKALADTFATCDKAFAAVNDKNGGDPITGLPIGPTTKLGALSFNAAHNFEHYGNLVTYLRIKGLVPPSSQKK